MTLSHYALLVACLLPIVCAGLAKSGTFTTPRSQGGYDNADPRAWLARQTGRRARANAAQANSFEALPLFIAAVLVSHMLGAAQAMVDFLSWSFIALRVAYIAAYVADRAALRSVVWLAGLLTCVALFLSPVWA
jgi:uncharacterized MAPEG superfamily protein